MVFTINQIKSKNSLKKHILIELLHHTAWALKQLVQNRLFLTGKDALLLQPSMVWRTSSVRTLVLETLDLSYHCFLLISSM